MKILILGAAGQIARMLRNELIDKTDHSIVLYARNGHKRLTIHDDNREKESHLLVHKLRVKL